MDLKAKNAYFGPYSLKALKVFDTMDGYAFDADLTENGRVIGHVHQGGYGGPTDIRMSDESAWIRLKGFCSMKPKMSYEFGGEKKEFDVDPEVFVDQLQNHVSILKELKRKARGNTLISLVGDGEYEYRVIKLDYSPAVKPKLEAKFGEKLLCILNEHLD